MMLATHATHSHLDLNPLLESYAAHYVVCDAEKRWLASRTVSAFLENPPDFDDDVSKALLITMQQLVSADLIRTTKSAMSRQLASERALA